MIGLGCTTFVTLVLVEHVVFRNLLTYNVIVWDTLSMLSPGITAIGA